MNHQRTFAKSSRGNFASKINDEELFSIGGLLPSEEVSVATSRDRQIPPLTHEAATLLLTATEDPHGSIIHARYLGGDEIQTNGKSFIEGNNPRSRAVWEGALKDLVNYALVEGLGYKGEIYQVTNEGYKVAELLKN